LKIGDQLKFYRIKNHMTQEEVANGIISVSYLSKIENNQALPSEEVLHLLCRRLGMNMAAENGNDDVKKQILLWYKEITSRNKSEAVRTHKKLRKRIEKVKEAELLAYFLLFELRYYLLLKNLDAANKSLIKLQELQSTFDDTMKYYYFKFLGLFFYCKNKYKTALEYYKNAEKLFQGKFFEKWEEADFYYLLALVHSQLWKIISCINYTQHALSIYQSEYDLKRSAECHILMGISFRRYGEIDKALQSYFLAQKIVRMINETELLGIIEHNIGYLMSVKSEHKEAIKYYKKSLGYKQNADLQSKFVTLFSLVRQYFLIEDFANGMRKIQEALLLIQNERNMEDYYEYYLHFKVYEYLMSSNLNEEFEEFMQKEVLPYFEGRKKHEDIAQYAEYMARYYEERHRYKLAGKYYKISYQSLKNIINF